MKHTFNPSLPILKKDYKGNQLKDGKFTNAPWPDTDASFLNVLKWFFTPNPQRQEKKTDKFSPEIFNANDIFNEKEDMISWLGHASFFLRLNGKNLLFDPVMGSLPTLKRFIPFPTSVDNIKNLHYILLSHGHRDHFDVPSLKKIIPQNLGAEILGPLEIDTLVNKLLFKDVKVQAAGWFQQFKTEDIKITFLPALHWHKRFLNDFNDVLWGSFMLEANKIKIFFAGDTAYGSHFKEIKEVMGAPDICILPIGAYKPAFLMKQSHMNPLEAIQAFHDLEGKIFIPMHYGTFDLANEPISEPIRMIKENINNEHLRELNPGEKFLLKNFHS